MYIHSAAMRKRGPNWRRALAKILEELNPKTKPRTRIKTKSELFLLQYIIQRSIKVKQPTWIARITSKTVRMNSFEFYN